MFCLSDLILKIITQLDNYLNLQKGILRRHCVLIYQAVAAHNMRRRIHWLFVTQKRQKKKMSKQDGNANFEIYRLLKRIFSRLTLLICKSMTREQPSTEGPHDSPTIS